jgi:Tfp pilus assembly protein FimV
VKPHPALARVLAPAAFLLAVTVLVLLVRSGLDRGPDVATPTAPAETQPAGETTAPRTTTRPRRAAAAGQEFYEIQAGDTLAAVAAAHDTTVERLLVLNPDIDPTGLQIGQRIRVK